MQAEPRYRPILPVVVAEGWSISRLSPPSRLYGANGIRAGRDGRVYVAQVCGSQVSAIDIDNGGIETISPVGGHIVGPDDLAFDEDGNIYCTEITTNRVSVLHSDGSARVLNSDVHVANPVTVHQGRLIVGELHMAGRILELDRQTGAAREIASGLPMPNAFEVGPDGKLYFPLMGANQIWRVDLAGGEPEVVATDLGVPDSVKFDAEGFIVSTQIGTGQVLRIDPRTGSKSVLAEIGPGLDNCAFVGDRLFVSHIAGGIYEVLEDKRVRSLVEEGLQFPMGLAVNGTGDVYVADAMMAYHIRANRGIERVGGTIVPGFPGSIRGVAADGARDWIVTTTHGTVARWWPGCEAAEVVASGFEQLMGVALTADGTIVFCDYAAGLVSSVGMSGTCKLASGLDRPTGLTADSAGAVFVAEAGAGRVVALEGGVPRTVIDSLGEPHGIAIHDDRLFILDVKAKQVVTCELSGERPRVLASRLPVGSPPGIVPKLQGGFGDMSGPLTPFSGLAVDAIGNLYIGADTEGSVLKLQTR